MSKALSLMFGTVPNHIPKPKAQARLSSSGMSYEKAEEMRQYYALHPEMTLQQLADKHGQNIKTTSDAIRGITFKAKPVKHKSRANPRTSMVLARDIRAYHQEHPEMNMLDLAKHFNRSRSIVYGIISGATYRE